MRGEKQILQLLLENGGKLDAGTVDVAARSGRLDMLKYLVDEKGKVADEQGDRGETPLLSAVENDQTAVAAYLADKTEMTYAVKRRLALLVEDKGEAAFRLLRDSRALEDNNIRRTAYLAALRAGESSIVRELLDKGADPDFQTEQFSNGSELKVLLPPTNTGRRKALKLAIRAGARADIRSLEWLFVGNSKDEVPKDAARFYRRMGAFKRVEMNDVDRLMLATLCRDTREIRRLGAQGVDPDIETAGGRFPLEMAIMYCDVATVSTLLEIGADPNPEEINGHHNLLGLARDYGQPGMEQALISAGAKGSSSLH
jgi:ankyrin repeat protein